MIAKHLALLVALALPVTALADDPKTKDSVKVGKLADADVSIVAHVHHVNVMEVDMGKLAQKQGTAKVKKFALMMVKEHGAADKELATLAKKKGVAKIPVAMPADDAEKTEHEDQMAKMANLKTLKGAEFDKLYITMMVDGHDKELAKNDPLLATATDADVKAMLEKRKTTLTKHAAAAKDLQKTDTTAAK